MARYRGPQWKLSRKVGISLSETGKELSKRNTRPGQHGASRQKLSEYGLQLKEKQKLRLMYGVSEKQFRRLFDAAKKVQGVHGENFMVLLERRLDNIVYRLGLATTRQGARQLVNHGHVTVDGIRVNIPSFQVSPNQVISLKEHSKSLKVVKEALESSSRKKPVSFVKFDSSKMEGNLTEIPNRKELSQEINESLIVEYYNR
jgi:small subunit ribosomal protein S4